MNNCEYMKIIHVNCGWSREWKRSSWRKKIFAVMCRRSPICRMCMGRNFFPLCFDFLAWWKQKKTLESQLFFLIFGLFRTATQTTEANFSHLTRTSHRNEMELKVWSTKRNSSPLRLRIWQNETFKKRCASWIHMIANIVVNKST